ncbi:MAG: hypothetical protein ACK5QT_08285 [Oligoflexia bacterium]
MRAAILLVGLLLGLGLASCNQLFLGIGKAVENLAQQPIDGLRAAKDAITGNTYSSYSRQTNKTRRETPQSCADIPVPEQGMLSKLWDTIRGVRDEICTCRPWGTCPKSNCSCEALCPDSFDIFSIHSDRNLGGVENELAFANSRSAFKNTPLTHGYCWGHASMTAKFNRLGFFQPNSRAPERPGTSQWRKFYSGIIDRIMANEATDIPGFANLHEFSSHPTIQEMLADRVAYEWGEKAMSFNALGAALASKAMSPRESLALVADIQSRLKVYQAPQLVFTLRGSPFETHAVLVHEVRQLKRGTRTWTRICLRENGFPAEHRQDCPAYIDRLADGSLEGSYGEIGGAQIAGNENADTVEQLHSLRERCGRQKGCS